MTESMGNDPTLLKRFAAEEVTKVGHFVKRDSRKRGCVLTQGSESIPEILGPAGVRLLDCGSSGHNVAETMYRFNLNLSPNSS